jgi:hypothetical protein
MHSSIIKFCTAFGKCTANDCHNISPVTFYLNLIFSRDFTPGLNPISLIHPTKFNQKI